MGEGIFRMDGSRACLVRTLGDDEAAWGKAKGPFEDPLEIAIRFAGVSVVRDQT